VQLLAFLLSVLLIATVLWDAFETVVLPRTVTRRLRLTRAYFRVTWRPWGRAAALFRSEGRRERFLAIYGPLSLLGLSVLWALGLVVGFAGLHWSAGSNLLPPSSGARIADDLYMSGTTFFTLGLGDLQPVGRLARFVTVAEAGTGFAFLAIVIAYFRFSINRSREERRASRCSMRGPVRHPPRPKCCDGSARTGRWPRWIRF
jgi:ion channel